MSDEIKRKLNEPSNQLSATGILYLLGETMLMEIDEKAEIQYVEGDKPQSFVFKMENGRILSILVTEVFIAKK